MDETTIPEDRFRPDDGPTCGELAEFMVRSPQPEGKRGLDMQTCGAGGETAGTVMGWL